DGWELSQRTSEFTSPLLMRTAIRPSGSIARWRASVWIAFHAGWGLVRKGSLSEKEITRPDGFFQNSRFSSVETRKLCAVLLWHREWVVTWFWSARYSIRCSSEVHQKNWPGSQPDRTTALRGKRGSGETGSIAVPRTVRRNISVDTPC